MAEDNGSIIDRSPAAAFIRCHPLLVISLLLLVAFSWAIAASAFSNPGRGPVQVSQVQNISDPLRGLALSDTVTIDATSTEDSAADYPFVAALAPFARKETVTAEVEVVKSAPQGKTADAEVAPAAVSPPDFASNTSLAGEIIVLDPGHGSADSPGVTGPTGLQEVDIVLDVSKRLRALLTNAGAKVIMTRETAFTALTNKQRAERANDASADVFLRLHAESYQDLSLTGVEALWAKNTRKTSSAPTELESTPLAQLSQKLAETLASEISSGTGFFNIGATEVTGYEGLTSARVPATQVSIGALSSGANESYLRVDTNRQRIAEFLYKGIVKYIHGR